MILDWQALDGRLRQLLRSADRSVLLVAPFVKAPTLASHLTEVPSSAQIELYTRWRVEDVASGVTDTEVLPLVAGRGGSVRLVDDLHAKLFAVDATRALVGSANLTAAGLGTSARPNLELLVEMNGSDLLLPFILELRRRSRLATEEEAASIEAAAVQLRAKLPLTQAPDAAAAVPQQPERTWFPKFRSPDRLFRLYADPEWPFQARPTDPALDDLAHLRLPGGLAQPEFEDRIREILLTCPAVDALDRMLDTPRRFGEVTAALAEPLPDADHRDRQVAAQTLIRWLLHFASDRYGLRTPNYSEVLYRR